MRCRNIAIQASGLVKWFGEGEAKTMALSEVNLEAQFGEMVYIVGPSGSGKTTLLSVLSGILRPNAAGFWWKESIFGAWTPTSLPISGWKKSVSYFRTSICFPRLTTAENAAIPLILKGKDWDESIHEAAKYLDIVGLKSRAELPPVKLSGGEQQRVAIARAMASQPDILIMDEPTASLDGDTGQSILSFVQENILNENRCILVVTHDDRIYEFATRILNMEDGRLTGTRREGSMRNKIIIHHLHRRNSWRDCELPIYSSITKAAAAAGFQSRGRALTRAPSMPKALWRARRPAEKTSTSIRKLPAR